MKDVQDKQHVLSSLPSVNTLLQHPVLLELSETCSRPLVTEAVRTLLKDIRTGILDRSEVPDDLSEDTLVQRIKAALEKPTDRNIRSVINATGIILHDAVRNTMMDAAVRDAVADAMHPGIPDVENHAERLLCDITTGEAACLLHSDLAAFWLAADTFGRNREVIISRGHMGARGQVLLMDLFERCGTQIIEVGATNKTHLRDYRDAVTDRTGAIITLRPATYALRGFAQDVPPDALGALGVEYDIPVVYDAGITTLTATDAEIRQSAVSVQEAVQAGITVTIAGSALTGGPSCGLAIGQSDAIVRMNRNPLLHLLKAGTAIHTGMAAALQAYDHTTGGLSRHPAGRMILTPNDAIKARAERLLSMCRAEPSQDIAFDLIESTAHLTASRLPSEAFSSYAVSIASTTKDAASLSKLLYAHTPALLTGITEDSVTIDLRTVEDTEIDAVHSILTSVIKNTCV